MRLGFSGEQTLRLAAFYRERARGGAALIITGGVAPNAAGRMEEDASVLDTYEAESGHKLVVNAVHEEGSACVMQILHAGRYAKHSMAVAPSNLKAPINSVEPHSLTEDEIERTIDDYVRCAILAKDAGYDGVDIMGSEGYLINEFTAPCTNIRQDNWGGSLENRSRFPLEIVRRIRIAIGPEFLILFRISALDLVLNGNSAEDTLSLARSLEMAGTNALTTGIGWHESRVPTIAYMVPRGAWRSAAARLKRSVSIPIIASNRINTPELAENILASGDADLVALARPLLADPNFLKKAKTGNRASLIPCIACNQACLDYIFSDRTATCLVNPRAGHESEFQIMPSPSPNHIAVVGAGASGLSFSITAASRGHKVTIFEQAPHIGGQLDLACRVPGKEEFRELLRYYKNEIKRLNINLNLSTRFDIARYKEGGFDQLVIATGVTPRKPSISGIYHSKVVLYPEVLSGEVKAGNNVAIIGAGAIAFDVAEFLTTHHSSPITPAEFHQKWGVDISGNSPGALVPSASRTSKRTLHILYRSTGRPAATLGISTGWILRTSLKQQGVSILSGCNYQKIDDRGLHYTVDDQPHILPVDSIVICAGQESAQELAKQCSAKGIPFSIIGGAKNANKLDAQRAISEGYALGLTC